MKILQIIPTLSAGGAEGFVTNLGVSLVRLGADVRFFLLAGVQGDRGEILRLRLADAGIQVDGVNERKSGSLTNLFLLKDAISTWKPDVVQANLFAAEVACACVSLLSICTSSKYVRRLANRNIAGPRSPIVMKVLDRFFECSIACSLPVAEAYLEFMGSKAEGKLSTIRNGAHLPSFEPTSYEKRNARKILGIPENTFLVVHIGSIFGGGRQLKGGLETGQKGHDVLIKSFFRAFGGDNECMLMAAGDGPLRQDAECLAKNLGLGSRVRFLGQVSEPWSVLKAADVFCFPSRYEGMPNVLPEAAACGLPIVASDISEIRNLSPSNGWLLSPVDDVGKFAEALRLVRDNRAWFTLRAKAAAHDIREQFSMNKCAKQYLELYQSIAL